MSHIPNKVMPHAATTAELEPEVPEDGTSLADRAGKIVGLVRAHPGTTAAAGAAVLAGAVAAAAIPLLRSRAAGTPKSKGRKSAKRS